MKKRAAITILMIVMAIGLFVVMASCDPKDPEDLETVKTVDVTKVGDYVLEGNKYVYNGEGKYELKFVKGVAKMRIRPTSAQRYLLETDFEHTLYIDGNLIEDVSQFKFNKDSQYYIKFVADESLKSGKCVVKRRAFLDEGERGVTEGYNFIPFTSKHDGKTWIQTYKQWFTIADEDLNYLGKMQGGFTTAYVSNIDLEANKKYYVVTQGQSSEKISEIELEIDKEIEMLELPEGMIDGEPVNIDVKFTGRDRIFKFIPKDERGFRIRISDKVNFDQPSPVVYDENLKFASIMENSYDTIFLNGNNKGRCFYIVLENNEKFNEYKKTLEIVSSGQYVYELKIDGIVYNEPIVRLQRGKEYEVELIINNEKIIIGLYLRTTNDSAINEIEYFDRILIIKGNCPLLKDYSVYLRYIRSPGINPSGEFIENWQVSIEVLPNLDE